MRRFLAGLVVGLSIAAVPTLASWGDNSNDRQYLGGAARSVRSIAESLKRIADSMERQTPSVEWSARSLERITRAQEQIAGCCRCPAEKAKP